MPLLRVLAGGKSFPLLGDDVNQTRTAEVAHGRESIDERVEIVSIDRTEVSEAKLLEEHAWSEKRLHALFPFLYEGRDAGALCRRCVQNSADGRTQAIVERVALNRREILRHRADVRRDRHLVVVQHDDEVAPRCTGVVEALVRKPAGKRAITEYRDDLERFAVQIAAGRHSQSCRDRRGCVSGAERVELAFAALQKSGESVFLTQRLHAVISAGEKLVRISLVADVPDDLVSWRVEHRMNRNGKLDYAEPGADVSAGARANFDETLTNCRRKLAQLVATH